MELRACSCHDHRHLKRQAPAEPPVEAGSAADSVVFSSGSHGFDLQNLDPKIRPQDDFYRFAMGGWKASHPIPDHKSSIGTFEGLGEANLKALHQVLEELGSAPQKPGSDEARLAAFYRSGMDLEAIEAAGARPIQPLLAQIASIDSPEALQREVAQLHLQGIGVLFGFGSGQDLKDSGQVIAEAAQAGLGLPERDFYFDQDDKSKEIRQGYRDHIARTLQLLGDSPEKAGAAADRVLAIETRLAEASSGMAELRDPNNLHHPHSRQQLRDLAPNWNWDGYLTAMGQTSLEGVNVATPRFFKGLNAMLGDVPVSEWKDYLRWHTIAATSPYLSKSFVDENFEFGKLLTGAKTQSERWKKVVSQADKAMGEALGRKFVETRFSPESKKRVLDILHNIRDVLHDDLEKLPWTAEGKKEAIRKLDTLGEKIGYPDKWKDYSELDFTPNSYVGNVLASNRWKVQKDLERIGKPVDRSEWGMTPAEVNAYYNPLNNEMAYPAGILQPPFFNPKADEAINYGAIGVVMGHEITHGFDDSGANFDAEGNLRQWRPQADKEKFQKKVDQLIAQANAFKVGDQKLKGEVVVGEALADLGGVELAFKAFQRSLRSGPQGQIDGFTPEQRFFLGFAQLWGSNTRPEAERQQILTDPHPVAEFRVNNTLSNVPQFADAFGAKAGDPMVRPDHERLILWGPGLS